MTVLLIGIARWATGPEDTFITNQLVTAEAESLTETHLLLDGMENTG